MRATETSVAARASATATSIAPPQPTIAGSRAATPTRATTLAAIARWAAVRVG